MSNLSETERKAHAIAAAIAPALVPVLTAQLALREARKADDLDAGIWAACAAVGKAVDRLEQLRFAGHREAVARQALEQACRQLRTAMARRRGT